MRTPRWSLGLLGAWLSLGGVAGAAWSCSSDTNVDAAGSAGASAAAGAGATVGTDASASAGGSPGAGASTASGGSGGSCADPNDLSACSCQGECVLLPAVLECCPARCGDIGAGYFTAVHISHQADYLSGLDCPYTACPASSCPAAESDAYERAQAHMVATCEAGHCAVVDLRQSPVTACATDAECRLRYGSGCCDQTTTTLNRIIALSDVRQLESLTCSADFLGPCAPVGYGNIPVLAVCGQDGHCTEQWLTNAGADAGKEAGTDAGAGP